MVSRGGPILVSGIGYGVVSGLFAVLGFGIGYRIEKAPDTRYWASALKTLSASGREGFQCSWSHSDRP